MKRTPIDALTARRLELALPLTRQAVEDAQLHRLRETLAWAKARSPYYRDRLAAFDPAALTSLSDLEALPFLDPADLRRAPLELLCVSQARISRIVTLETSGSTGPPKRLFFTGEDLAATSEFFHVGMRSLIAADDRVLVLLPYDKPDGVGDLLLRALAAQGVACSGIWPLPPAGELAATASERRATSVVGLPLHLLALAEALPEASCVRSMLLCSDYAPEAVRSRIEAACGCETFLHYGATETGLGGGVECGAHQGCHLRESDLLVEIVAPETGLPLADGELGEVVVTTLARKGMPLVRYRTGDLARLDRSACRCGGIAARLRDIRGRLAGCRIVGDRQLTSQDLDDALFGLAGLLDFRASLDPGQPDSLSIEYLAGKRYPVAESEIEKALLGVPAVREAVQGGHLAIGDIRPATAFGLRHTVKRSILDRRP